MGYIQLLGQYKEQMRKVIVGLRNIEKCFSPENDKIMRVIIKYKGGNVKREVEEFENGLAQFLKLVNNNFVTFSVREDYRQVVAGFLDGIKKIEVSDVGPLQPMHCLAAKLQEVYERPSQEGKKEIARSIGHMLAAGSALKRENEENEGW
jgi:hypothetical protein